MYSSSLRATSWALASFAAMSGREWLDEDDGDLKKEKYKQKESSKRR